MPKLIEFEPTGIRCDAPGCGWRDDSAFFNLKTNGREWLNVPCPNCGANLYTEKDFKLVRRLRRTGSVINALFGWVLWFVPKSKRGYEATTLHMNGTGKIVEIEGEGKMADAFRQERAG